MRPMTLRFLMVCIGCLLVAASLTRTAHAQGAVPPAAVHVAPLQSRMVADGRTFVGDVVPIKRSVVGSAVAGRVEKLHVVEGTAIGMEPNGQGDERGQPLVSLRDKTASLEVAAAAAEVRLREKELEELMNGTRPEELAQALARQNAAEALVRYAETKFQRTQGLFEQGTTPREEFDEALSAKVAAEQGLIVAQAAYQQAKAGPRAEQIEQARARLDVARERLALLVDIQSKYTIRTPFEGFVVAKNVEVGDWVSQGDPVAEVVVLDPIEVRVAVPEEYVAAIRRGMEVRVAVDSLPDQSLLGVVDRIVPQADLRARTFPVIVHIDNLRRNDEFALMPGMTAHVTMAIGPQRPMLLAPKDALIWNGQDVTLILAEPADQGPLRTARIVPVQLGVAQQSLFQVIDPRDTLKADQLVVTIGNERLRPGQPLRIVETAPAP